MAHNPGVAAVGSVRKSIFKYTVGYVLSLALTFAAFATVTAFRMTDDVVVIAIIVGLAVLQLFVQLVYFLHLGDESKPRWNLISLLFALLVVGIVVIGSLWIMNNLNYNMMSPHQLQQHMQLENQKGF